jgi:predicted transcriptional regulator
VQQKIEHVKQIQNEIINRLSLLVNHSDQADYELSRAKLFFQIKEIALLQSAQMVDANREYQKSVEVITSEFLHLSDCISGIDTLRQTFVALDNSIDPNGFDADLNIRKEVNLYNEIDAINSIFRLQTEGIIQRILNFSNSFALIYKTCSDFAQVIRVIRQQQYAQNGDETATVIMQMSEVAEELFETITGVKIILDENAEAASELQNKYNAEYLENKHESIQKQEVKILSNAFRELNYLNREVLQTLNLKMNAFRIPSSLKESIESVCYYKHFEIEISHIISCLDEISNKMKAGDAILKEEDREAIDSLYQHYTMDSEHRIHNSVTRNKNKATRELFKENIHLPQNGEGDNTEIFE